MRLIYTVYFASILPFPVEVPVAFSTHLTNDAIITNSPVIFDVVDLNIEDGYDEFTGILFTDKQLSQWMLGQVSPYLFTLLYLVELNETFPK